MSRTETKGTLFSALGELLWYLARTNGLAFITYYVRRYEDESDDGHVVRGGYGPRLFDMRGHNQVANVIRLLSRWPHSRRAVIQLFNAEDLSGASYKEVPCTCTLQFHVNGRRLELLAAMRSNDAFLGITHDVFAFTMLQELIARSLGLDVGSYKHAVGSLHLYDKDVPDVRTYLDLGYQSTIAMPKMPTGDPWSSIRSVLGAERHLREDGSYRLSASGLADYWRDIVRLLAIYRSYKDRDSSKLQALKEQMKSGIYDVYIDKKLDTLAQ